MDFTDMVENFLINDHSFETDYFIVDEAQDLTPLQWDFVYLMAAKAKKVYIAGDDDQAIHEWNGASVEEFLKLSRNVDEICGTKAKDETKTPLNAQRRF